jgi:hypothetical protein
MEENTTARQWLPLAWRVDAALGLASIFCFAAAWLDIITGALRGAALLFGLLGTMIAAFTLIGYGAWKLSGVIVAAVERARSERPAAAPRRVAFAAEHDAIPAGYTWRETPAVKPHYNSARINKIRMEAARVATN